jgi:selenide,water dikinase
VDDPYEFGRVAATNAISDIYAMGGKPILAISILSWPIDKLSPAYAQQVLEGAREQCKNAGISIAGGHSIAGTDPVFGLAVNGIIDKKNIKLNHTIQLNDKVYFTKSLGTGVYSTALKKGLLKQEDYQESLASLTQLNSIGYELGKLPYVGAMTDVTGFAMLGHLTEMIGNSGLTAVIEKKKVGTFKNLMYYINQHIYPGNTTKNYNAYKDFAEGMDDLDFLIFCDPQTAGGLLFTVHAENESEFENWLKKSNYYAKQVGTICKGTGKKVRFI